MFERFRSLHYKLYDDECIIYLNRRNTIIRADKSVYDILSSRNMEESIVQQIADLDKENSDKYDIEVYNDNRNIKAITLFLTDSCNLRCSYCYERSNTDNIVKINEMELTDTTDVIKILKKYSSKEGCSLIFFGGEPLLKFDLIKSIVKEVKSDLNLYNKISYSITTNATRITKEIASFFKENNFAIVISIDGGEKITNINRKHANGKGAYEAIKSKILLLDGMFLNARATITNTNLNLTENHIALYNLGFSSIAQSESYELIDNQNISVLKVSVKESTYRRAL